MDNWNNLTRVQMEQQLIRQAQLIGELRSKLDDIKLLTVASAAVSNEKSLHRVLTRIDGLAKSALNLK